MAETRREKLAREMTNWQASGASGRPLADWVGEIAGRARSLAEVANPAEWWRQLGPNAWAALAPAIEARIAQGGEANAGAPGYQQMLDTAMNFGFGPMGMIGQTMARGGPLPKAIPDELGVGAPAERVAQWRKARENAALPVEQGGLGLRPDNTAAERAKAMGFEGGWGHGSPSPKVEELRGSATGAEGPGAYATNFLPETGLYSGNLPGATVYPLSVRAGRALDVGPANPYEVLNAKDDADLLAKLAAARKEAIVRTQERTPDWLIKNGAPLMPERQHFVSTKPDLFRSRFAAFDPKRQHEADLLASWLLPLTLGGGALGYGLFGQPTTD